MKDRLVIGVVLLMAVTVAAFFLFRSFPNLSGPLRHEAYVWQRAWIEPVRNAVGQHGTNFSALCVLKAEVSWRDGKPRVARVALDYPSLTATQRPVGIALRIGPYAGPFVQDVRSSGRESAPSSAEGSQSRLTSATSQGEAITAYLAQLAASIVAEARSNHINLSELQIDFDCASSKLDGYRVWVEAIQRRVAPLPVTITALPSWLNAGAFERLAAVATNYVLQVHSLERPKDIHAEFTLCDPRAARRAVERAGRIGVPFRVALPTYGYTLAFDKTGRFIGLSAEGPRPNWPADSQLREVRSDPVQMAALVQQWTARRPAAMRGVIWYRLPTIVDNFNWRWPTLGAIVASRSFQEKLRIESRRVEPGLVEISLVNDGDLDLSSRLAVEVRWADARLVAGDALRDFELVGVVSSPSPPSTPLTRRANGEEGGREWGEGQTIPTSTARFQTKLNSFRLPAGDSVKLGWLRLDRDCEVRCELKQL